MSPFATSTTAIAKAPPVEDGVAVRLAFGSAAATSMYERTGSSMGGNGRRGGTTSERRVDGSRRVQERRSHLGRSHPADVQHLKRRRLRGANVNMQRHE